MNNSPKQTLELHGATLTPVSPDDALNWIKWVLGEIPIPASVPPGLAPEKIVWLLAHCVDGVTWGRRESGDGEWQLGSSVFDDLCPVVSQNNLLELRLFGDGGELLLWRDECDGAVTFRGRWLTDAPTGRELPARKDPYRPEDEDRVLLGNQHLVSTAGFTRIGDGTGREQAVPLVCHASDFGTRQQPKSPLRLKVRHYFTTDLETGAVRVAASRLANVFNAASQEDRP